MKNLGLFIATLFCVAAMGSQAFGQLLTENFSYTAGTNITANGWTAHDAGGTNPITVSSGGLTYSGYVGSGVGNAASMNTTGEDDNRTFTAQTSGSIYVGFMVNVSAASTNSNADYFLHLSDSVVGTFRARVFVRRDASNNLSFGISKAGSNAATTSYSAFTFALNTTYLFVVKYTIVAGATNDTVDLFINPTLASTEPAPTLTAPDTTATDLTNVGSIALRQGGAQAPTQQVDGIRVCTNWTCATPTATDGTVAGRITDFNGDPVEGTVIRLEGTQNRKTITNANGEYSFTEVETNGFYTITPLRLNYSFSPASRSFSQLGNVTEAAFTGAFFYQDANVIDNAEYFVRQHYLDFLGREPDEAGFNFWSDEMMECGLDPGCFEVRRINVSAAYFFSIEFQNTGGLVDRLYVASYGRRPLYAEFGPDNSAIAGGIVVGRNGWEQQLVANKQAFVGAWVDRQDFHNAFDGLSNEAYVDALMANAHLNDAVEREALVSGLNGGTLSRGAVLQRVAENENFVRSRFNEAFVLMEYFGYLRRDPDAEGYAFWLNKLNSFGGDFQRAEMVKAFIHSSEYRNRFTTK